MPWPRFLAIDALAARWPGRCQVCRDVCRGGVCEACLARFAAPRLRCPRCALPLASPQAVACGDCLRHPPPFSRAIAALDYAFPWDGLVTRFKFHDQPEMARPLARMLVTAARDALPNDLPELLVPVPLGDARLAERGYNQAWELARHVAPALGLAAEAQGLARWRDTPHQVGLGRAEREHNLRDAFTVPPAARPRLRGRRLALVDDVVTTGATAAAAARTLLAAGAAEVQLWMVARTPAP